MGLKDLHGLPGDDGAPHATDQLLRFPGKHHSRNHLYPAWSGSVKHAKPPSLKAPEKLPDAKLAVDASRNLAGGRGGVSSGSAGNLRIFWGYPMIMPVLCGFSGGTPREGRNFGLFWRLSLTRRPQ